MSFIFIADYFVDEILGGGELNNEELASSIEKEGYTVLKVKSEDVNCSFLDFHKDKNFIIFNFVLLSEKCKRHLQNFRYVIYEHDHKYLQSRNPAIYPEYVAPKSEIINYDFYSSALTIFCQTRFHAGILRKNLHLDNIVSLGGNLWSDAVLDKMLEYSTKEKENKCSIMVSNIEHKNTREAILYCKHKKIPYELISEGPYYDFLDRLSNNSKLIFLPKTPETLSRIVVEARMMNMGAITNSKVGATSESWYEEKGYDLIEVMRSKKGEILDKVVGAFSRE